MRARILPVLEDKDELDSCGCTQLWQSRMVPVQGKRLDLAEPGIEVTQGEYNNCAAMYVPIYVLSV